MKALGILLCFSGFLAFSYYRHQPSTVTTDGKADPDKSGEIDYIPLIDIAGVTSTLGREEGKYMGRSMWPSFLRISNKHEHRT